MGYRTSIFYALTIVYHIQMTVDLAESLAGLEVNDFASSERRGFDATNVAPIKKEYIVQVEHAPAPEDQSPEAEAKKEELGKQREDKNKRRGMNKNRRKEMKQAETRIRASNARLCPSVIHPGTACKFGEKCTSDHDVATFLSKKSADIAAECPLYDVRGKCPFSYACRFAGAHTDAELNQLSKEVSTPYAATLNTDSIRIQIAMRKHEYDFGRSEEALKWLKSEQVGAMEREKPKLDMKSLAGKTYLAPLTTVGNLPFRRLCVDLGVDITCGEMALATAMLGGTPSEFSLVKRHPCEKVFGVQLAGGFADTMTKTAQILVDEYEIDFIDINMGCPIDVVNQKGGGCALANRANKTAEVLRGMRKVMGDTPLTVKLRTGLKENVLTAHDTVASIVQTCAPDLFTFHPRSKEQRYTKSARWDFVPQVAAAAGDVPLWVCGDVLSWQDYYQRLEEHPCVGGVMIGRGALIKPWLFTEIEEKRDWDISATERFDMMKKFVHYGLDHWGSDDAGVERTRRFLLEWLSFTHRYIPVGLLEVLPQRMNDRPPLYRGRNELETLLSSTKADDWVEISRRLLGPTPDGFTFIPKHKASSY